MTKLFPFCFIYFAYFLSEAQLPGDSVAPGKYNVGFRTLSVPYPHKVGDKDSVQLILNIWYPTQQSSGNETKLVSYTFNHLHSSQPVGDSIKVAYVSGLRRSLDRWFGTVADEKWIEFQNQFSLAIEGAAFHDEKFPLILGRLRIFSTALSNEIIASHGYVVCMLNAVEDFPPMNKVAYQQQLTNEINFYAHTKEYLQHAMKIVSSAAGLMGFSGSGLSQFMAPMASSNFCAVALLESGVYLENIYEVLSTHPAYDPGRFNAAVLFLYNKQRYEKLLEARNFSQLKTTSKHLALFDYNEQHHWDFATEGTIASLYLESRTVETARHQLRLFSEMNRLIVAFFDQYLKNNGKGKFTQGTLVVE